MNKKPIGPPESADLFLDLDGEVTMISGMRKAYVRNDGSRYVKWYGKRIDVDEDNCFGVEAKTGTDGLIYGLKSKPITRAAYDRIANPEYHAWATAGDYVEQFDPEEIDDGSPPTLQTIPNAHHRPEEDVDEILKALAP